MRAGLAYHLPPGLAIDEPTSDRTVPSLGHDPKATLEELEKKQTALVTTTDVVDEIVTLVRYRLGHAAAITLGNRLLASSWCRLVEVTGEIHNAAWQIFVQYKDQSFSLTDC